MGQGLKDDQSVLAPIKPAAGWLVRASSKEKDGAGGHDRGRACASNYLIATLIAVTCVLQPGADFTVAQAAGFAFRPPKATRFGNHLRPQLSMRFPATDLFAGLLALAFPRTARFGNQAPLFRTP